MNLSLNHVTVVLQFLRMVVALMVGYWAYGECSQGLGSADLPTVKGTVTSAVIKQVESRNGKHDEAQITYTYTVKGKTYTSDRIQFGGMAFRNTTETIAHYKAGQPLLVHYKSYKPSVDGMKSAGRA